MFRGSEVTLYLYLPCNHFDYVTHHFTHKTWMIITHQGSNFNLTGFDPHAIINGISLTNEMQHILWLRLTVKCIDLCNIKSICGAYIFYLFMNMQIIIKIFLSTYTFESLNIYIYQLQETSYSVESYQFYNCVQIFYIYLAMKYTTSDLKFSSGNVSNWFWV